jgi:type I restriction enzyme S subunit
MQNDTQIKTKLIPKLRFIEFEDDFKSLKMSNLTSLITKGTTPKKFTSSGINYVKIEGLQGININKTKCLFIDKEIHFKELKRSILKEDDILFAIAGATVGKVGIVTSDILPANTNQALAIIRLKNKEYLDYILQILQSRVMKKYIYQSVSVGAQPNLNLEQIGNFKFNIPSIKEQQKIAAFLTSVDTKIQQLTTKKKYLENYKKGVMQQLFSQQLRFKNDDGFGFPDWEEKTLDEVANFRRGSFPQPYGLPKWYDKKGMPFVQVYDVGENMLLKHTTKQYISKVAQEKSVFVEKGTLVLTIQGSIGRIAKTQYDAYVDRTLLIFQSYKIKIDVDYFKYIVYLLFEIEKIKAPGGTIKTITKEKLSSFIVKIPSLKEQQKIANYLSAIDTKIENVQTQIEKTQAFKKGLLQQMFV